MLLFQVNLKQWGNYGRKTNVWNFSWNVGWLNTRYRTPTVMCAASEDCVVLHNDCSNHDEIEKDPCFFLFYTLILKWFGFVASLWIECPTTATVTDCSNHDEIEKDPCFFLFYTLILKWFGFVASLWIECPTTATATWCNLASCWSRNVEKTSCVSWLCILFIAWLYSLYDSFIAYCGLLIGLLVLPTYSSDHPCSAFPVHATSLRPKPLWP